MEKNILVLGDTNASGEWVATVRLIQAVKKIDKTFTFSLIAFSAKKKFYGQNLFSFIRIVTPVRTAPPFSFLKRIYLDLKNIRKTLLEISISYHQVDYILITHYLMVIALLTFDRMRDRPIIYEFQGIRSLIFMKWQEINYREIIVKFLERVALISSSIIITPTVSGAKFVRSMLGILGSRKEIEIIPNGISSDFIENIKNKDISYSREKFEIKETSKVILYSGSIGKRKGLDNLLYAFGKFHSEYKDSILMIAYISGNADNLLLNTLIKLVLKLNLSDKVYFLTDLSPFQMAVLYSLSDLTVLPSVFELQPLSVLESLACGTPCIGTDIDGIRDILMQVDRGMLFKTNEPENIYNTLRYFYKLSKKNKKSLKDKCVKIARKYDITVSARKLLTLLSGIS